MIHPTIAHIDLEALQHNVALIKKTAPNSKILAMVKSNAYGHGAVEISLSLANQVDALGVIFLKEAEKLAAAGVTSRIVILAGFFDAEELAEINAYGFDTVVHCEEQLKILERAKLSKPLSVWLKIDTGMHRLGFAPEEVKPAYERLAAISAVKKPLHLMSHFSDADNILKNKTLEQLSCFNASIENLAGELCLANSSAILNWPSTYVDWVRPGITLHGVSPLGEKPGLALGFKPVMTLTTRIITIHNLKAGAAVGYGSSWICPEDMRIAIIAIGYGDGYPRNTRSGTPVLIHGVRCPIIGKVAMDMITVDLRNMPQAKVGDNVVLWGRGLPAEEVAQGSDSIPYELFCRMTQRIHYKYYANGSKASSN